MGRCRLAFVRLCFLFWIISEAAFGQEIQQDASDGTAIIEDVSRTWQENYLRLQTWEGKARIKSVDVRAEGTTTIERELEFSLDMTNDRLIHYGSKIMRFRATGSTEEVLRKDQSGFRGVLRTSDSSISVFRTIAHKEEGTKLVTDIKPRSRKMRSWLSLGMEFDPVLPMWSDTIPVDVELKNSLLSWKARDGNGFSVQRTGDDVAFTIQLNSLKSWQFAMSRGANPAKMIWEFGSEATGRSRGEIQSQFVKVGDVWIPESGHHFWKNKKFTAEIQLDFLESKVNQPLSDDRFSLTRLEISDGDAIWDTRFQAGYRFDSAEAITNVAGPPASQTDPVQSPDSSQDGTAAEKDKSLGIEQPAVQQAPQRGEAKSASDSSAEIPIAQALPFWKNKGIVAMGSLCLLCLIALTINWFRSQGRQK